MKILTHPKELTRENLEEWRIKFVKKLKRTTTREDSDRLILAVERREFKGQDTADWKKVIFENGKGKISHPFGEEFKISEFERKILDENETLKNQEIKKSALKEENGDWNLDGSLKEISRGGEAVVLEETIAGLKVAVRVQCFDSALFTGDIEDLSFDWHLSKDFEIAENNKTDDACVIPHHDNVIAHFANCEITQEGEIVGWITVMELCDTDLRKLLKTKNGGPNFQQRKKIAIEVKKGRDYLKNVGIEHKDTKPENVLMKNGVSKWTDFGLIVGESGRKSYRKMGYARRGSKFRHIAYLYAGSAGFAEGGQLVHSGRNYFALTILILCDWNTAWTLLFKPLNTGEKEKIEKELQSFNAGWMIVAVHPPEIEKIEKLTGTITLKNAFSNFNLDDRNLTKSCTMGELKRRMTKVVNCDFKKLTKDVLDQKDSNLCVPISVSVLLRWALKNDLKVHDSGLNFYFTAERILTQLTMIIYPRSLAGMNLNPKNEEKQFQHNEIELLLRRMKNETYLNESGWEILLGGLGIGRGSFEFDQVLLHTFFNTDRPLTVTGAYMDQNGEVFFHQMTLEGVENGEYVLQNTLHSEDLAPFQNLPLLRIDCQKRYYGFFDKNSNPRGVINTPNGERLLLTNETCTSLSNSMTEEEWYLLPEAYSITLTPITRK